MESETTPTGTPVDRLVMPDLPTRFRAVMWDAHWEFDAPCVMYLPFMRFGFGGNSGRIDSMVEDICIDIAIGQLVDATAMRDELEKECEWRGWSVRGMSRRKDAWHVQWDVRWWKDDADELQFEMMNRVEQRGPFKA